MSEPIYYKAGSKVGDAVEILRNAGEMTERELNVKLMKVAPDVRERCHLRDRLTARGFLQKTFKLTDKGKTARPSGTMEYRNDPATADAAVQLGRWMMSSARTEQEQA